MFYLKCLSDFGSSHNVVVLVDQLLCIAPQGWYAGLQVHGHFEFYENIKYRYVTTRRTL